MTTSPNETHENNFPLETSGTNVVPQSGTPLTERLKQDTSAALDMSANELNRLDSDTATGTLIKTSTLLNAGFVLTWWGPAPSSESLNEIYSTYGSYLAQRIRKTLLEEDEKRGSVMWSGSTSVDK